MSARRGEAWNEEGIAALRRMHHEQRSEMEIARALERTLPSVLAKISLLKRRSALGLGRPDYR